MASKGSEKEEREEFPDENKELPGGKEKVPDENKELPGGKGELSNEREEVPDENKELPGGKGEAQGGAELKHGNGGDIGYWLEAWEEEGSSDDEMWDRGETRIGRDTYKKVVELWEDVKPLRDRGHGGRTEEEDNAEKRYVGLEEMARIRRLKYLTTQFEKAKRELFMMGKDQDMEKAKRAVRRNSNPKRKRDE